ncbi:MAG: hypothetical protein HC927_10045, partial [Deltaproteobacteria bacterium]|nr:hypothetical protein [Deltaproteobacteria bacterium]
LDAISAELEHELVARGRMQLARKALTIWQPWAWMIAHAPEFGGKGKRVENRVWKCDYRGPLHIHVAGPRSWSEQYVLDTLDGLRAEGLLGEGLPCPSLDELREQRGKVIARARVTGCRKVRQHDPDKWAIPGQWAIELDGVELVEPVVARGERGIFDLPAELAIEPLRGLDPQLVLGRAPVDPRPLLRLNQLDVTVRGWAQALSAFVDSLAKRAQGCATTMVQVDGEWVTWEHVNRRAGAELGETPERIDRWCDGLFNRTGKR